MKYLLLALLYFYGALLIAHEEKELEKVSLQFHWKYQFEFAGFIAAKEKGFYKDAGLDVELKEYVYGMDLEDEILSGRSQYGLYNSYTLVDYLKNKPIKLVSSYFKRAALVLITTPDIKTPIDLIGKKIMASTKEDFILNYKPFFDGYDVSVEDVELVPHTYTLDDFIAGKVSAMTAFVSDQLIKLDEKGIPYNVLDPSDDNIYVLQMELFTSHKEVEQHPKRVSAFKNASIKGWQYALSHKEEIAELIHQKYNPNLSVNTLLLEAKGIEKLILPYTYEIGSIDENFLKKQIKLFKEYYHIGKQKKLEGFIYKDDMKANAISLTKEELGYINKKPSIRVCLQYDQFPIDGYRHDEFIGMASDVYALLSNRTSLKFTPLVSSSFEELQKSVNNHNCDLLSLYATKSTSYETLQPTRPITTTYFALISKLDRSFISDSRLLEGKIILTQLPSMKKYLQKLYPYLTIEVESDKKKMLDKLLRNEAYAIVVLEAQADYIIDKSGYGKFKVNGFLAKEAPFDVSIGVQKEEPLLLSIIQKGLETITKEELKSIKNSWRIVHYQETTDYSLVWKVLIVMSLILFVMMYYQRKLKVFNRELECTVYEKTKALREVNESLEVTVQEKVQELVEKDEILTLQSKQAVMGEMISMIAHQWRQPLNMLTLQISNIQIKHMMGNHTTPEELESTLNDINETIQYLSETIDDFKTYFHPNKEKTDINIDELIQKVIHFVSGRLKSNTINIRVKDSGIGTVHIYMNELIQVLLNIINNAIDAYDSAECEDKFIEIEVQKIEDKLFILIKDGAGGIPPEVVKQIFEPYFSTKGKNGTGLGLYMSQMIMQKQFKGEIKVDSVGNETTFIVAFKDLN